MALVSLELAKQHLRILDNAHDADIQSTVDQASAYIVDILKESADDTWTELTVPLPIQLAILKLVAWNFAHRGDDPATRTDNFVQTGIWSELDPLLIPYRDPALR